MAIRKAVEDPTENYNNIPEELKQLKQWVVYGVDMNNFKCPYNPTTMRAAKAGQPDTWSTYEQAIKRVEEGQVQGIGFEFNNNGVYGVDLDHVFNNGVLTPEAEEIVNKLDSYTEISPSGEGVHILVKASGVELEANRKGFIEIYNKERYFTVTGNVYSGLKPLNERTEQLEAVYNKYLKPKAAEPPTVQMKLDYNNANSNRSANYKTDDDYLEIGLQKDQALINYWNGGRPNGDESRDDQGFMNKLAYWCNKNESLMKSAFISSPYCGQKDNSHTKKAARNDYLDKFTIPEAIRGTAKTARETDADYSQRIKPQNQKNNVAATTSQAINQIWEKPIPFDNITVPPFPIDCLPPALRNYVVAVSESTQTPVDMAAVAALSSMAVCVQGKYKIQGKPDWIEPLNLYSAIVANPAERKSTVLNLLTKYINEYEYIYNQKNTIEINRCKLEKNLLIKEIEQLLNQVAKGKGDKDLLLKKQDELSNFEEVKPLRLLADDATPEALASLLVDNNGRISVISTEGGIFEMLQGRYSTKCNIDVILKAYCGDDVHIDRKGRASEYVKEPCMTILLSIQPQVLDGLVSNEIFRGRGLTARFLYCIPTSIIGNREFETEAIPDQFKTEYRQLCFELLDIIPEEVEILKLSNEAYELSAAFAKELEPRLIDDLENMADFAGKLHGTILRIAGILHVVKEYHFTKKTSVSKETMQDAIQLGRYFLEHARAAYQLMGADEQLQGAKYVLKQLEKQDKLMLAKYDIFRLCRGKYKKVDEIAPALELLFEFNYLKEQAAEQITDVRPKENRYVLNPKYFNKLVV